jgi:hypothetical protein
VASTEAPISITVKTAAGSLVTVRAESGEELDQLVSTSLDALVSATTELESAIKGGSSTPMTTTQVAAKLGASIIEDSSPTGGWSSGPVGGGKHCPHGKMTAIQGTGKDGSTYRGYFCPAPKGAFDKCKNQYVKAGSAEWNTFVADQVK